MIFRELEEILKEQGLLDKFNKLKDAWEALKLPDMMKTGRLPNKDTCIFYISKNKHWFFPFRITKKGVLNIQWLGGVTQKNEDLKTEFIKSLKK